MILISYLISIMYFKLKFLVFLDFINNSVAKFINNKVHKNFSKISKK